MLGGEGALRLTQSLRGVWQKTIHFPINWKTFGIITCMLHKIEIITPMLIIFRVLQTNVIIEPISWGLKLGPDDPSTKQDFNIAVVRIIFWYVGMGPFPRRQHLWCYLQLLKLDFTALRDFECQQRDAPGCDLILFTLSSSLEPKPNQKCFPSKGDFPNIRFRDGRMAGGESLNWISKP